MSATPPPGQSRTESHFFALLRFALNTDVTETETIEAGEWPDIYAVATRQSLRALIYKGIARLPKDNRPPTDLMLQWYGEAEKVHDMNLVLNDEAARLTRRFTEEGHRTVILKGQANARLYPDPQSRQPGDIDIWVEGGRKSVLDLLEKMGLMKDSPVVSYHHVHLHANERGVDVEVHFRPSSGNMNPFSNRRLQKWLKQEIVREIELTSEGFCVPSVSFALMMQLSHIQRHFLAGGIGLRQIVDYYMLLRSSTLEDRQSVADQLKRMGLWHTAGAVMWLQSHVLALDESLLLCPPDEYRGQWMLREIMESGNFGQYARWNHPSLPVRFVRRKHRWLQLLRFDFWEVPWFEVKYWSNIILTIPKRIRLRTFSLRDVR